MLYSTFHFKFNTLMDGAYQQHFCNFKKTYDLDINFLFSFRIFNASLMTTMRRIKRTNKYSSN